MINIELVTALREPLRAGLSVFQEKWFYKAKDWITSIHAADINHDGYLEIIACSRDGRVMVFDKDRRLLWQRVVGSKRWVGAIVGIKGDKDLPSCIIAGTRDGNVYAFAQDGQTIGKDGTLYPFDQNGRAIKRKEEIASCWLETKAAIRQVFVDPTCSSDVIVGSEDGNAYAINIQTRELHWKFQADGWVRAVCHSDIDGDGRVETIIGSNEKTLYVLSDKGETLRQKLMHHPIHAVFAADIDLDGQAEILVATDGKDLITLSSSLEVKWTPRLFNNRILALYVTDINHDGQPEIIAGSEDKHVYILNYRSETLWRHYVKYRVMSVYAADINNDDRIEILVGAGNDRAYEFNVELIIDLEKRILSHYQNLQRALKASPIDLTQLLPADELHLLQDILGEEEQRREEHKHISFKAVNRHFTAGRYYSALVSLLKLEHFQAQVLLRKGKQDGLENIRSLCIGHTPRGKKTVVLGTNDGDVRIFTFKGKCTRVVNIGTRILDVHTGFIDRSQLEHIIVCTSDHKVYIVSDTVHQEKYEWQPGSKTACIYVNKGNRQRPSEILTGSDTTIVIYEEGIDGPFDSISLQDDVGLIHAYTRTDEEKPEIIAGSVNNTIYAYKRMGMLLWHYEVWDRVLALDMKDIDWDGEVEVIVGSEDRNIHVLDNQGRLRWRFFLPHSVLAVKAADVDQDGQIEILAGCADGWLYVFNKDGDLLWKYRASDRIRKLAVADVDDDGNPEIVIAAEDELEILSVVDRQQAREYVERCLKAIQGSRPIEDVFKEMLHPPHPGIPASPELRAFALVRLAKLATRTSAIFDTIEHFVKDNYAGMRKALIQVVVESYALDPQRAIQLLNQLAQDTDLEVRLAFIEQMAVLMERDWETGLAHLEQLFSEGDRMVRRAVVRQLAHLIGSSRAHGGRDIFTLLLKAARDEDSEWIRQEAARALGHFLDSYRERLIIYMHLFLVNELRAEIMELIGHYATGELVRNFVGAVMPLFYSMDDDQILDNLGKAVQVVREMTALEYGKDMLKMYEELYQLFTINTIEDIAAYRCLLTRDDFRQDNQLAVIFLEVLKQMNKITRYFGLFLRRESVFDRLASLLDAQKTIDAVGKFVERAYSTSLMGYSIHPLPDHALFVLLLNRWRMTVMTQLHELRGVVELKVELQTKTVLYEERIAVLFKVSNTGRRTAETVKISLMHSNDFDIIGNLSVEAETLLSDATLQAEFTLKLKSDRLHGQRLTQNEFSSDSLTLKVEVAYGDAEQQPQPIKYTFQLELLNATAMQEFRYIPNRYSTGTPVQDALMFYGRDDDVAALRHSLTDTASKAVILLYGQRRTGKTTLLLHLARTNALQEHIPVFIDMQRESYNITVNKFLHNVAFFIAQAMNKRGYSVPEPEIQEYAVDPTFVFDIFLDRIETQLHERRLIILIDEFEMLEDQIKNGRLKPEFLDYLRSIMQHHQHVNFLLAGAHRLEQLTQSNWSVFFNIARQYRLSRLSASGAESLIKKPVAEFLEYGPFTVEKIRDLTADQPYLIHLLCRALIDLCNEQRKTYVTINDVNDARRVAMQTCASHFDWLWKHLLFDEQRLLAVMCELSKEDGRWLSYHEIEERYRYHRFSYDHKSLYDSIKSLRLADIVEIASEDSAGASFTDERFRIPAGLMRLWLLREKPLLLLTGNQQTTVL